MRSFLVALAFLTIVPIRFREMPSAEAVARSRFWYPVVGLLLGALLGGWTFLVLQFATPMVSAFLVLVVWVGSTGALHLDGLCDLCDGLFGGKTSEERLRIMKDPHLGTFGVVGVVLLLLGKYAMLSELLLRRTADAPWLIAVAVLDGRSTVGVMAVFTRYPRAEGTGKALIQATNLWSVVLNIWLATLVVLAFPIANLATVSAIGIACIVLASLAGLCAWRLGGVTGDCLGAGIELAELSLLTASCLALTAG
jgi:adenosylcobinamide-GDP ribazoletransferase